MKKYPHESYITEDAEGRYVEYKDYAALQDQFDFKQNLTDQVVALQKQCDALAAENAVMLRLLTDISENHVEYFSEGEGYTFAGVPLDYVSEINTYVSRDVNAENPFPATDAYLNSVRADAVQALWDDSLNDVGHVLEEIGAYQDASEAGGIVHSEIQERVDDFVAQLRAGKDGE